MYGKWLSAHSSCKLFTGEECLVITLLRNYMQSAECTGRPKYRDGSWWQGNQYGGISNGGIAERGEKRHRRNIQRWPSKRMMWEVLTICCVRLPESYVD